MPVTPDTYARNCLDSEKKKVKIHREPVLPKTAVTWEADSQGELPCTRINRNERQCSRERCMLLGFKYNNPRQNRAINNVFRKTISCKYTLFLELANLINRKFLNSVNLINHKFFKSFSHVPERIINST